MSNRHHSNDRLNVTARLDRRLVGPGGGTRHILVDLVAPKLPQRDGAERPPLNLGLVIDVSGSMHGEPLEAAKAAAEGVVDQLGERDRITVVSFASDVMVHADAVKADARGRRNVVRAIRSLQTRGSTNLSSGWLEAADAVRRAVSEVPGGQNRLVLLSDGHANAGIVDPEMLQLKADALRTAGIYTSCVGIGDDYSPTQLEALAEHGGGRLHDAPLGEDIVAVVMGELGEILGTFADDLAVTIAHPRLLPLTVLGPYAHTVDDGRLTVRLGTLVSGARRRLVVQAAVPAGRAGDSFPVAIDTRWRAADGSPCAGEPVRIELLLVPDVEVAAELADLDTARSVAELWQRHILHASTLLNTEGRYDDARALVDEHKARFRDYCAGVPGTEDLVLLLESHGDVVYRPMAPRRSKLMIMEAKLALKNERDYRRNGRSW